MYTHNPRGVVHTTYRFTLRRLHYYSICLNSPSRVTTALCTRTSDQLSASHLLFVSSRYRLPIVSHLNLTSSTRSFVQVYSKLNLRVSRHATRHVLSKRVGPIHNIATHLLHRHSSASRTPTPISLTGSHQKLHVTGSSVTRFSHTIRHSFGSLTTQCCLGLYNSPGVHISHSHVAIAFSLTGRR